MLYVVTNRRLIKKGNIYSVIEKAIAAGINGIIIREKDLNDNELFIMTKKIQNLVGNSNVELILNGNLKIAKELKIPGYHTSFKEFIKEKPDFEGVIGVSVHSIKESVDAEKAGADYVLAGHVFETDCKKGLKPRGTQWIAGMKSQIKIPIIAIGGIKSENIFGVIKAGASGVAVMSEIMEADDPYIKTQEILRKKMSLFR